MPKEVKAKGERKKRAKKGIILNPLNSTPMIPWSTALTLVSRPQCPQTWSFCLHVLRSGMRQTTSSSGSWLICVGEPWFREEREPRYHLRYTSPSHLFYLYLFLRMILIHQVKSARSSVNAGRTCPTRKNPNTKPKQPKTRNATKLRRGLTTYPPPIPSVLITTQPPLVRMLIARPKYLFFDDGDRKRYSRSSDFPPPSSLASRIRFVLYTLGCLLAICVKDDGYAG